MANIEGKIEELLESKITDLGYELYDVQYVKEGKDFFLRIFIDKAEGIDLEDCEKVSNEINPILDDAEYITDSYFLEVSSPGIERTLRKNKHLKDNIGNEVEIKLFRKLDNTKQLQGVLQDFNENQIILNVNEKQMTIDRKDISVIKTVYNW